MNIKEAEQLSGISRQNIRFYEKEGLLRPERDPGNEYRHYEPEDIRTLKIIRVLRMLDMPLDDIRRVLSGSTSLSEAANTQKERLSRRTEQLEEAIRCCDKLSGMEADTLDADAMLHSMESSAQQGGYFSGWLQDYRVMASLMHKAEFTFVPDSSVANAQEFTEALYAFAKENELYLEIVEESMHPIFTLNGIEYKAFRTRRPMRGIPMAVIRCAMTNPPVEESLSPRRRPILRFLQWAWPGLVDTVLSLVFIFYALSSGVFPAWCTILLGIAFASAGWCGAYRNYYFHFNDKTK